MRRKFLRLVVGFLFRLLTRLEVSGLENIPSSGGCLLCPNHIHLLDTPLIFIHLKRQDITGLVAKKHQKNAFFRWIVDSIPGIWLNRDEADTQAIRTAVGYLKRGWGLGIAPEGTRSKTGTLILAKTGVAYLADRAGVPIIPIAIMGTETAFSCLKRLRRPRIILRVGQPLNLPPVNRLSRDVDLEHNTDEIMCQIAAMLAPEYRGVYADHPRLKELTDYLDNPPVSRIIRATIEPD